jgi:D-aminopeptidase
MERPPIGVKGHGAVDPQMDSFLSGVPFLPVKRSFSRFNTIALHSDGAAASAIRSFARACVLNKNKIRRITLPRPYEIAFSFDSSLTRNAKGKHGLRQVSRSVLSLKARSWTKDVESAYDTAISAAIAPFTKAWGDLDLSEEAPFRRQKPESLRRCAHT